MDDTNLEFQPAKVVSFTDREITKGTFNKGIERARLANNSKLWVQLFNLIATKYLDVDVWWMPSHTDKEPKKLAKAPAWMKGWHVKGNQIADDMAGPSADLHRVPSEHATHIVKLIDTLVL